MAADILESEIPTHSGVLLTLPTVRIVTQTIHYGMAILGMQWHVSLINATEESVIV